MAGAPKRKLHPLFKAVRVHCRRLGEAQARSQMNINLCRHILFGYFAIFLIMINQEITALVQNHWRISGLMLKCRILKDRKRGAKTHSFHSSLSEFPLLLCASCSLPSHQSVAQLPLFLPLLFAFLLTKQQQNTGDGDYFHVNFMGSLSDYFLMLFNCLKLKILPSHYNH